MLKAFKEQDANGNGDPDDEISLITAANGWHVQLDGFHAGKYPLPYHSGSLHQLLQKQKGRKSRSDADLRSLLYLNVIVVSMVIQLCDVRSGSFHILR